MNQQLNRRMSWGALIALIVVSASVLPVAAHIRVNEVQGAIQDAATIRSRSHPRNSRMDIRKRCPRNRDLEARIEQLERLVQELSKTVKLPAVDSNKQGQMKRDPLTDPA